MTCSKHPAADSRSGLHCVAGHVFRELAGAFPPCGRSGWNAAVLNATITVTGCPRSLGWQSVTSRPPKGDSKFGPAPAFLDDHLARIGETALKFRPQAGPSWQTYRAIQPDPSMTAGTSCLRCRGDSNDKFLVSARTLQVHYFLAPSCPSRRASSSTRWGVKVGWWTVMEMDDVE